MIKDIKIKKGYSKKPWVIENKRFTEEEGKFLFHCPMKINYRATGNTNPKYAVAQTNENVNQIISNENENILFLGIDRGEKHLAYYSLVDENGVIKDQGTLNMPFTDKEGNPRSVMAEKRTVDKDGKEKIETISCRDYNDLLEARAGDRDYARRNWQTIGNIKNLKDGYVSQVIRKIADLAVQNNAFIVLENLSVGFKRGRQKIEKQVYQKLELALAKKLGFLVDKNATDGAVGSVTKALQLAPPVKTFGDMEGKGQFGIILYTRANYTSQTDPLTGWVRTIYLKSGSAENIKKQIFGTFSDIVFDGKDYVFSYTDTLNKEWKLYSGKDGVSFDRFRGKRGTGNEWRIEKKDIVEVLDIVFNKEVFDKDQSFLKQLKEGKNPQKFGEYSGWESLRYVIDLIQQVRNTGNDERDADFLQSPVRDPKTGENFDSRVFWDRDPEGHSVSMPVSGDANGAYNIARKGIVMAEHIRRGYKTYIRDEEWSAWLAGKECWERWMRDNEKDLIWKKEK